MHKQVLKVVALLITMGGFLSAQAAELNVGGVVGVVASRLDIDDWGGSNWHTDAAFGGFLSVELSAALSIRQLATHPC